MNESAPAIGLPADLIEEIARTIESVGSHRRGLCFSAFASLSRHIPEATAVTVDLSHGHRIGGPLVVVQLGEVRAAANQFGGLTPRELQVSGLLSAGKTNKAIATELGLTLGTVKDHVHRILHKTGTPNRASFAAAWARQPNPGNRSCS